MDGGRTGRGSGGSRGRISPVSPDGLSYRDWRDTAGGRPQAEAPAGFLLRSAREAAGLTQVHLARSLGVSQQAVCQAERREANPTVLFVRAWAAACGTEARVELREAPPTEAARVKPAGRKRKGAPGERSSPAPLRRSWTAAARILWS